MTGGPFDDYIVALNADRSAAPVRTMGFYWLLINGEWMVCFYRDRNWLVPGWDSYLDDLGSTTAIGPLNPLDSGIPANLQGVPLTAEADKE